MSGVGFFLVPKLMEDNDRGNRDRKAGVEGGGGVGVAATTWTGRRWTGDWTMGLNMCIEGIYRVRAHQPRTDCTSRRREREPAQNEQMRFEV